MSDRLPAQITYCSQCENQQALLNDTALPALERTASFHDASKARGAFERRHAVAVTKLEHEEAELWDRDLPRWQR